MRDTKVGIDDPLVRPHLVGRPVRDLPPVVENHHPVRDVHDHSHVMLDEDDGGPELVVGVEDEPAHVLLLFGVHPRHRLVEEKKIGLRGEGPSELHPLLEPVGQAVDGSLPDRLDLEEVDDPLHRVAVLHLLAPRGPEVERLPQEVAAHLEVAPGHEVVEHRHALEESNVLEGAGGSPMRPPRGGASASGAPRGK